MNNDLTKTTLYTVCEHYKDLNVRMWELIDDYKRLLNDLSDDYLDTEKNLDKIKEICKQAPAIDTELSLRILEVIEGAEDDN